jgi:predicted dehydrogenase
MTMWLIGAGAHAQAYAKVLNKLRVNYVVIGRGGTSAERFTAINGVKVLEGGLSRALADLPAPEVAIVAVTCDQLASVATQLVKAGSKRILLEKPGGLSNQEIRSVYNTAKQAGATICIAYNRRFYASTLYALNQIAQDGGIVSCTFEFTEWANKIAEWSAPPSVKETLVLSNSSHVLDLAFYLCGAPKDWSSWHAGDLPWHKAAERFCGAGLTDRGVLFSYHADWAAPGRWSVDFLTRKHRFIFKPMEQLHRTTLGSTSIDSIVLNDQLDRDYKPGLYRQVQAFLDQDYSALCLIEHQVKMSAIYSKIAGYK